MIRIENLSKKFKHKLIFESVNLQLEKGHIYGFVGPNGCGKSIFFKVLAGFLKPSQGKIYYQDKILGKDIDILPNLDVMIETPAFIEHYNQMENLMYLASIKKIVNQEQIEQYLAMFGLDSMNQSPVRTFSLGMRQKLAIIQAIMEEQEIIILDEPFNGLDKSSKKIVIDLLHTLKAKGKLILLTTHIEGDMEKIADKIYQFNQFTVTELTEV